MSNEPQSFGTDDARLSLRQQSPTDVACELRCGECYSLMYWSGYQGRIRVPYGTLTDTPSLKPIAHKFVGSKAACYEILDDLPQYNGSPWDDD